MMQKESSYKCPICHDTGWILIPQEHGMPLARSCECRNRERVATQWKRAGINLENSKLTFGNFKVWNSASKRLKDTATAYFSDFDKIKSMRQNSIMFCGQPGGGKTHISIALALNFFRKGIRIVYMSYRETITKLKMNIIDEEVYKKTLSKYQTAEILLIDDLFKGRITSSDLNICFELINYRYLNHLPMIISSELMLAEILGVDEGVGSRIYEMCKGYAVEVDKNKENNFRLK